MYYWIQIYFILI